MYLTSGPLCLVLFQRNGWGKGGEGGGEGGGGEVLGPSPKSTTHVIVGMWVQA